MKSLSFSLLLLALFMAGCETPEVPVFVNPIDTTTVPGEEPHINPALVIFVETPDAGLGTAVKVSVTARVVEGLSGVHVQLNYNRYILEYTGATLGQFFTAAGESWIFDEVDGENGKLDIYTSYLSHDQVDLTGTGAIVELTFTAISTGEAAIDFIQNQCRFVDAGNVEIDILEFVDGVIVVQ